jgi:hypothetical protein
MIALIQPYGLKGYGGGPRLMRSLLDCDHPPAICIATLPAEIVEPTPIPEFNLPVRPQLGRLERTRFSHQLTRLDPYFSRQFEKKLTRLLRSEEVKVIHLAACNYDLVPVTNVALKMGIPLFLSVYDDIEYVTRGHKRLDTIKAGLAHAWNNAAGIFSISDELGEEYGRRYGNREFITVTDGLRSFAAQPLPRPKNSLRIYFMGLHHYSYIPNFRSLLDALKILRTERPDWPISLTMRCGAFLAERHADDVPITVLPFAASDSVVDEDMLHADLLYQPLPFAESAQAFGKFSLSTKLVTYLGSGVPILYHGPEQTAVNNMLKKHDAAIRITTEEPAAIARALMTAFNQRDSVVERALKLARERFSLEEQQRRFWGSIGNL